MTQKSGHPQDMRWDGWGDPARASRKLPGGIALLLTAVLGRRPRRERRIRIEDVRITTPPLAGTEVDELRAVVGPDHVLTDPAARLTHAGGRSTPDLVRRTARRQEAPGGVVLPGDEAEVEAVLRLAARRGLAVVPFGGGTAVTGGLAPDDGGHRGVISLDLRRLAGLEHLDEISGEAVFGAGTRGPAAEAALAARGFELGHFPQSYEYASLGGFAAMRSSGQNSAGHGRFDDMVTGLRVVTPTGTLDLGRAPGSAAGPDLVRMFLGSEGVLGVITRVRLRVHAIPEERFLEAFTFPDFATGVDALRRVTQAGGGPTVIRLSDEAETAVSLAQVGSIGKALSTGCAAVVVHEGARGPARARRRATGALLRAAGGRPASGKLVRSWDHGRFDAPYLRDTLLGHGVFVETLETATTWSNLHVLRAAVTDALTAGFEAAGARHRVLCHVSHVYPTGASLYFTVVAAPTGDPAAAWAPVKARVNDAIMATGGTISHHHGVGADHAPWLTREIGEHGVRILRALKRELDPAGILNPGTLIP